MYHDKKTSLNHQGILSRRGFNIPVADAVLKVQEELKAESTKPKAKTNSKLKTKAIKANKSEIVNPKS